MNDNDIRQILRKTLKQRYRNSAHTVIIEEMGIYQGKSRVDIAVINGSIKGFEIKSESDTLTRLAEQQNNYNKIFDYMTIVASSSHIKEIRENVPTWWGIAEVKYARDSLKIKLLRAGKRNEFADPNGLVQLLWKDEALDILRKLKLANGMASKPRLLIWQRLVEKLSLIELQREVRAYLKKRQHWRPAAKQVLCDG
jgi:hypothetical protein